MRIADEWNKQQSVSNVIVTWTPGDYGAKLTTALAAGTGPDVYESSLNIDRVRNNHVVNIDALYTPEIKADFDPRRKLNTLENKLWGIQMIIDTGLIYFRKSMLDVAGVKVPTTFEELTEAAKTLTSGRVKGMFLGNDGGSIMRDQNGHAAGVDFIDADNNLLFNTPQLAEAWTKAHDSATPGRCDRLAHRLVDPSAFVQGCAPCVGAACG